MTVTNDNTARRPRGTHGIAWQALLRTRIARFFLMLSLPVVIAVAGVYFYLFSGRYVSTDDAYVKASMATLSTDVAGRVVEIDVHDNDAVKQGQILFHLDDRPYRYALDLANAKLTEAQFQIEGLRASYRQKLADLQAAQDTLSYQQKQFERAQSLVASNAVSQSAFDAARNGRQMAVQTVTATQEQIANILAMLGGNPDLATEQQPLVQQAQAQVDQATLDLSHTIVLAPSDGIVSKVDRLQVGQYLNIGTPAFALVSTSVWVEANFKETDLTHMRPGNKASVTLDAYPGHSFEAEVQSVSPGTGAEFSILPAQNATGNWVKVTQRVPVRVTITNADPDLPLAAGMSADVEVDTGYRRRAVSFIEHNVAAEKVAAK